MTGTAVAGFALSAATVLLPLSPRRRLMTATAIRGRAPLAAGRWAACCVAVAVAAMAQPTTVLAAAVVGATAVLRCRRLRRGRRDVDESRALETGLDILVGELRVGAHPVHAFTIAAAETGQTAVAASFRAVAARARLGADVPAGLRSMVGSPALSAHWGRLAVCWQLATDHGLAMSALMRAAQRDIAERHRFSARVASGTAGARATAAILAGLPVLGVLLGQLIGADPVGFLLDGHAGGWLLVVGVTLACVGLLWSDRITNRLVA